MDQEREVEKHLKSEVKKRGGLSLKWTSPGIRGVPDQILCLPNGDTIFVELKRPNGSTRKLQDKMIRNLRDLHQTVFICHSRLQVDTLIRDLERIGCFNR